MSDFDKPFESCLFCESTDINHLKTDYRGISIYKCGNCRVQFMNPQYTAKYLDDYYSQYTDIELNRDDDIGWREALLEGHGFYISMLEKYHNPGRFLSVGCGDGIELEVAKSRGWEAEGYDVDPITTEKLSARIGLKIRSGEFVDLDYTPESFEAVYLHHVLEHPKNPHQYLRKIHEILKPNGLLFIACPNINSVANSFKTATEKLRLRKNVAKHYDTWHHLFYYDPYVLKKILEQYFDFKVELVRNGYHVRPGQSKLKRHVLKKYLEQIPHKSTFMLIARKA